MSLRTPVVSDIAMFRQQCLAHNAGSSTLTTVAVILVIVIGTVRLIGGNANSVFSEVASGLK